MILAEIKLFLLSLNGTFSEQNLTGTKVRRNCVGCINIFLCQS